MTADRWHTYGIAAAALAWPAGVIVSLMNLVAASVGGPFSQGFGALGWSVLLMPVATFGIAVTGGKVGLSRGMRLIALVLTVPAQLALVNIASTF